MDYQSQTSRERDTLLTKEYREIEMDLLFLPGPDAPEAPPVLERPLRLKVFGYVGLGVLALGVMAAASLMSLVR